MGGVCLLEWRERSVERLLLRGDWSARLRLAASLLAGLDGAEEPDEEEDVPEFELLELPEELRLLERALTSFSALVAFLALMYCFFTGDRDRRSAASSPFFCSRGEAE